MSKTQIKIPLKAKTKSGHHIKKLPPNYPLIGNMQKEFKTNYVNELRTNFINKLEGKLKTKTKE